MNKATLAATTAVVFAVFGWMVAAKEQAIASGRTILLELAPADPRSLMQGDYMVLRYAIAREIDETRALAAGDGTAIVAVDANDVATFVRLDDGGPLGPGEQRLKFQAASESWRGPTIGAESYFFEEGRGEHFAEARYGELIVTDDGDAILVGLRETPARRL